MNDMFFYEFEYEMEKDAANWKKLLGMPERAKSPLRPGTTVLGNEDMVSSPLRAGRLRKEKAEIQSFRMSGSPMLRGCANSMYYRG
jgi:hypothetical protein